MVASPDGADGSMKMNADARLYVAQLDAGQSVEQTIPTGRHAWVQVTQGTVRVGDQVLTEVEVIGIDHGRRRVQLDCRCMVDGKKVLIGEATVLAPSGKFD